MERAEFVTKVGELLSVAKPNLVKCELVSGKNIKRTELEKQYGPVIVPEDEYVVVTCKNGYNYKVNITGDSLCGIAEEVFTSMAHK